MASDHFDLLGSSPNVRVLNYFSPTESNIRMEWIKSCLDPARSVQSINITTTYPNRGRFFPYCWFNKTQIHWYIDNIFQAIFVIFFLLDKKIVNATNDYNSKMIFSENIWVNTKKYCFCLVKQHLHLQVLPLHWYLI